MEIVLEKVTVLKTKQIMDLIGSNSLSGLSIYKDIMILFDEDLDKRLLKFVEKNEGKLLNMNAFAVYETQASLYVFTDGVNNSCLSNSDEIEVERDIWKLEIIKIK